MLNLCNVFSSWIAKRSIVSLVYSTIDVKFHFARYWFKYSKYFPKFCHYRAKHYCSKTNVSRNIHTDVQYLLFFSTFDLGLITLLFCIAKHQQLMLMSCLMVYNFFQESKCNNCFKEKECLGSGYIASNELKGRVYYYQGVMPHVTSICSSISDHVYMMHRYEKEQIFVKISNVVIFN